MLAKIKFALAAILTIGLTSAAMAVHKDPAYKESANKIDHRYPQLAAHPSKAVHPSRAGFAAFARAEAPGAGFIDRSRQIWLDRATGRGW